MHFYYPQYINKLELCSVILFDRMSGNLEILCLYGGIIVNIDNGITYNVGSHEFLTAILDMSLNELSRMLCDWLDWNIFEIEVDITQRILQTRVNQAHYISVLTYSKGSVNSMFGFARINAINMLELYLNNIPRRINSLSIELT